MNKVLIALAAIILAGFLVGFTIGKLSSPDYTVQANILKYIYSQIETNQDDASTQYLFSCGGKTWAYDATADSIKPDYSLPWVVQKMPTTKKFKTMNLNMMYSIAGGGPTAVIGGIKFVDYLAPLTQNQRVAIGIAAVVTTLSGAYWGYRLGYSDDIDCSDALVQEILNDKNMWRTYAAYREKMPTIGVKK